MFKFVKKVINNDFIIIDSRFPQKKPLGFRNAEINWYLDHVSNLSCYTMFPMKPGSEAWFDHGYGFSEQEFMDNKNSYLKKYRKNGDRIHYLGNDIKYKTKLAYTFFLAETYVLLPFLNKNKIPFVFVLYPGGAFGLDNPGSDKMLKSIFNSKYFRNVIVTQEITKKYLINKKLCDESKISYIYGGFVQFTKEDVRNKRLYRKDKKTFDICFVAAKYSEKGVDKGYDMFIDVAKRLSSKLEDVRFHVIGGFSPKDLDVSTIKEKITFYGYKEPEFLTEFYSGMDIFLSPNKSDVLFPGNFDGFPLGIDAGYCGVALFVCDDLGMNVFYENEKDIFIIKRDPKEIERKILFCYNNLNEFYDVSQKGCTKTQELFDMNYQINQRIAVFNKYVDLDVSLVMGGVE